MNRLLGRDRTPPIRHPIFELIIYRSGLPPQGKDPYGPLEAGFLEQLPSLDKNCLNKLSHLTAPDEILGRYSANLRFSADNLTSLGMSPFRVQHFDLYVVIVCFQTLQWIFRPLPQVTEADFLVVLDALTGIIESPIPKIVSFIVNSLFSYVLSLSDFQWSSRSYRASFAHFRLNTLLDSTFFPKLQQLLKRIIACKDPGLIDDMLLLVDDLVWTQSPIVDIEGKIPLLDRKSVV
jgi:hypothetical protein